MKNKPEILIITSWYPSDENPTEGSFVHEQVKMLQKNGHKVTVIKPNLGGTFTETLKGRRVKNREYQFNDVTVFEVGVDIWIPKQKKFYYKKLSKKVIRLVGQKMIQPDIIHSHALLSGGIVATELSNAIQKPLIHTEHTSGLIFAPEQFDAIDRAAIHKLIDHAKKILFVSNYAKEHSIVYKDSRNSNISVMHNIVDETFFTYPFTTKKNQIIAIGDFSPRKNQVFLLDAWKRFLTAHPEMLIHLFLAGKGFDTDSFSHQSKGISNLITYPRLNRDETLKFIAESKLLISASRLETFGLTIAEALALGTPVLVTDSGGPRDIVEEGDGFIIEQNNADLFVEKIVALLEGHHDHPDIIRMRCQQKFSEHPIYSQLIKTYNKCLQK
ncbi:MAG: glycosyltransferase family 4 protein [Flavobacteriia bacterium]|nr:glycosyltransferase family 4 protein [Flavobacteriia bacterium]OJX36914.1 MAG: hypothetical protein BGO87_14110 [Flavobacteriia bacterium 40-80]